MLQGEKSLPTPFTSILCGVEGNPASTEAARQAIALAESGEDLQFTAVYTSFELGPDYHKDALEGSLEEAARLAAEAGVSASYELREAKYAIDVLLPESKERDLLVIGTHGNSRTSGILFGSTASEAAHGAERPLLIAREAPGESPFPKDILVASDGTPGSWEPVRAAAKLAASFDAKLDVVHVDRRQTRPRRGDARRTAAPRSPRRRAASRSWPSPTATRPRRSSRRRRRRAPR